MSATLLPFLYQTRTLQCLARIRAPLPRQFVRNAQRGPARTPRRADPIPFEFPEELKQDLLPQTSDTDGAKDTITPSERRAFDRIFEEIAARRAPAGIGRPMQHNPAEPGKPSRIGEAAVNELGRKKSNVNDIIAAAAADSTGGFSQRSRIQGLGAAPFHRGSMEPNNEEETLLRFPPTLRRAARLALGVEGFSAEGQDNATIQAGPAPARQVAPDEMLETAPSLKVLKEERTRKEAKIRIEGQMRACQSDVEIWDVLEKEVFAMVEKLGINEQAEEKPSRRIKQTKQSRLKAASAPSAPTSSESKLSMDVYGPLYPILLISGLRMLDNKFLSSSRLCLSVLPRIKELGLASYVLGISTGFYNHLMSIYWYRYNDVHAVLSLLEEMQRAGLYLNQETQPILDSMGSHLSRFAKGEGGRFLQDIMQMPEYKGTVQARVRHWQQACWRDINGRPQHAGF